MTPEQCHGGRASFPGRPPAGTNPWLWLYTSPMFKTVDIFNVEPGGSPDLWGATRWHRDGRVSVLLHPKLTHQQRNATLAHELHHVVIGGVCRAHCRRNEVRVLRATARWLVPDVVDLAERMRRQSLGAIAKELQLPSSTIWGRLQYLTPFERRAFDRVMGLGAAPGSPAAARTSAVAA